MLLGVTDTSTAYARLRHMQGRNIQRSYAAVGAKGKNKVATKESSSPSTIQDNQDVEIENANGEQIPSSDLPPLNEDVQTSVSATAGGKVAQLVSEQ